MLTLDQLYTFIPEAEWAQIFPAEDVPGAVDEARLQAAVGVVLAGASREAGGVDLDWENPEVRYQGARWALVVAVGMSDQQHALAKEPHAAFKEEAVAFFQGLGASSVLPVVVNPEMGTGVVF